MPTTTPFANLITFSRGSNATVVGPNGLVQWAPSNLLTFSEQFDNAAWGKTNATITANSTAAPDGATTADTLVEDTTNGAHGVSSPNATVALGPVTWSVYVKAGTRSWVWINAFAGGNNRTWFNLANGTVGTTGAGATASITSVGNGWYRCSVTLTSGTTTVSMGINAASADNTTSYAGTTSAPAILIWGAQLELGSAATTYNPTTVKNLLGFSEAFDNAAWTKTRASIVTGAQANPINGLFDAQKLMEDTTASNTHFASQTFTFVANPYTFSVYAKAAGRNWVYLALPSTTNSFASFNLSNGTVGTVGAAATAAIQDVGNGWYRCRITSTATAGAGTAAVYSASADNTISYTGDGNSGVYIYGAQLSDSASLDPYVPTPGAAPSSTAYYGPRFDYNPATLQPRGILIEEQRTNLLLRSEEFDNASWTKTRSSITANATTSPDGTVDADKLVENTSSSTHYLAQFSVNVTSGVSYSYTMYAKAAERTWVALCMEATNNAFNGGFANFNLSNGTVGFVDAGLTASITAAGNGWYRLSVTSTATATAAAALSLYLGTANNVVIYTGDGTSGAFVWGAQLEAGAFATSYIPTVASTVTRSADVATMTGANFSSWYNQSEGTFVVGADAFVDVNSATTYVTAAANDGTTNNYIRNYEYNGRWGMSVRAGGAIVCDVNQAASYTANVAAKTALAYKADDFAASVNGNTILTDTSGALPTVDRLTIGSLAGVYFINGHIRSLAYYPDRLSNTQLQSLTT